FLGLAELDPKQRLSLKELAQIKDPQMAGWIVSAHLETDMLDAEQAAEIVGWPDLDSSVKVIVAAMLAGQKKFDQPELAKKALQSDNLARRGLAALTLLQLGDPAGQKALD